MTHAFLRGGNEMRNKEVEDYTKGMDNTGRSKVRKGSKPRTSNHPEWYTREQVLHQSGLNFAALTSLERVWYGPNNRARLNTAVRAVCYPGVYIDESKSAVRKASDLYMKIRAKNAGAANYNPTYVLAYVLALEQLYAGTFAAIRMAQAVRSSVPGWSDSPYVMAAACGVENYQEFTENLANYTNDLALIAKEVGSLPIPYDMTLFNRTEWLYSKVFLDEASQKASPFVFLPVIAEEYSIEGGNVDLSYGADGNYSATNPLGDIIAKLQGLLNQVLADPVFAILRGDLIKAYGVHYVDLQSKLAQPLELVYDPYALSQIKNMNYVGMVRSSEADAYTYVRYPSNATTTFNSPSSTQYSERTRANDTSWLVDAPTGADMGQVLAITRLMQRSLKTSTVSLSGCSGTFVAELQVLELANVNSITITELHDILTDVNSALQSTALDAVSSLGWLCSTFSSFPFMYVGTNSIDGKISGTDFFWDINEWASLSDQQLDQLDELAIRSLFETSFSGLTKQQ